MRHNPVFWAFAGFALVLPAHSHADVSATKQHDIFVLENEHMRLEVDASAGARIRSWIVKPGNREMVALWKGRNEIGGALDDRAAFTAVRYAAAVTHPGPESASLRFEATHTSGLGIIRHLDLRKGSRALGVRYEFRNNTQAVRRLFIRNFLLPGAQPQTDAHLYWVNGQEERKGTYTEGAPTAAGYYLPEAPPYAALWHRDTGDGILALVPGVSKFYFWQGSREFPTFEWLYEDIPAGQALRAEARLIVVSSAPGETPNWPDLCSANSARLQAPSFVPVQGWIDEATQFGVTEAERQCGFWLSLGEDTCKCRVPDPIEVDLARDDSRYIGITLNLTRALKGPLTVSTGTTATACEVFLQTDGEDRRELLPLPKTPVSWQKGDQQVIWLKIDSQGRPAGSETIPIRIRVGKAGADLQLKLTIWGVVLNNTKPFHVRGYCGGFPVWTKGYDVTEDGVEHLEAILKVFADIGGDVIDWNAVWARVLKHTMIAGTQDILPDVAREHPERIDLAALPKLDFSYYDPWLAMAKKYGVTHVETYMGSLQNPQLSWRLLTPAVGKDRVEPGSPEAHQVIVWFYREIKRYFEEQGFQGFFCKISDEISPEHIPRHIEIANVVRETGWRPFTTITGMIARTAGHIETMNPHCDQWQLSFGLKDDFLSLLNDRFVVTTEEHALPRGWRGYSNGGARDTWGMKVLGEDGAVKVAPQQIEDFQVLEDGTPLTKEGGSPWGNRHRGTVITGGRLHEHLYISPATGTPEKHEYTLKLTIRRKSADGTPIVRIDPDDEVWCYGGGSRPYRGTYGRAWCYPLMTLFHGFQGYGLWAFYHWNKTERIVWIDPETKAVTLSPAYCGYRDGWRDACLLSQLKEAQGAEAMGRILGETNASPLHVSVKSHEVYSFRTVSNAGDPVALNLARRKALEVLSGTPPP